MTASVQTKQAPDQVTSTGNAAAPNLTQTPGRTPSPAIQETKQQQSAQASTAQEKDSARPVVDTAASSASIAQMCAAVTDTALFSDDTTTSAVHVQSAPKSDSSSGSASPSSVPRGLGDMQAIIAEAINCQSMPSATNKAGE